jgi:hypothetical protein
MRNTSRNCKCKPPAKSEYYMHAGLQALELHPQQKQAEEKKQKQKQKHTEKKKKKKKKQMVSDSDQF